MPAERVHVIPHGAFDAPRRGAGGAALAAGARGPRRPPRGAVLRAACAPTRASTCWSRRSPATPGRRGAAGRRHAAHAARAARAPRARARHRRPRAVRAALRARRGAAARTSARADVVVLPYREIEQSGVLYTALAFGTPLLLSAVGGFPEIAAARRRAAGRARAASSRCAPGSVELLDDERARAALSRGGARRSRAGEHSWERAAELTERPLPATAGGAPRDGGRGRLLGVARPDRLHARRATRCCCARSRGCAPAPAGRAARPSSRRVSLIVAAHDEAGRDRARRCDNALALDYPPERLEVIVASDGSTRPHGRAGARGRPRAIRACGCSTCRGAGRCAPRTRPSTRRAGEILAFSDANALWERGRAARAGARRSPTRASATCAGELRYLAPDGSNQEGAYWRYENGVRALESRLGSVTAGNGAIYAVRREAYLRLDPRTSHDLVVPVQPGEARVAGRVRAARRARSSGRSPTIEGEFRRKRRMMSHAWPAVLGGGMLDPRGYGPAVRARDLLAPRAALRDAVPARDRARRRTSRCSARAGSTSSRSRPSSALLAGALLARLTGGRPAPARAVPLLRADDRVAGGRAVGLAAPRHAGDLGAGGRPIAGVPPDPRPRAARAVEARARRRASRRCCWCSPRRCWRSPASRSGSRAAGSPIYRQRRVGQGRRASSTC